MSGAVYTRYESNVYFAGDNSLLMDNGRYHASGTRRCIIVRSGHGSDGTGVGPLNSPFFFEVVRALVDADYTVYSINAAGGNSWWNAASTSAVAAAITHLQTTFGVTKWAGYGGSLGGGVLLQALKTLHTDCVGLAIISGACDLDYFHGTAGYTPAYTLPVGNEFGDWTAECETAYATNAAGWAAATAGHRIRDEYASWSGLGVPIRMWQGDADVVVPHDQALAFVNGVSDANVTLRTLPGAGHTPPSPGSPYFGPEFHEYIDFYDSLNWS